MIKINLFRLIERRLLCQQEIEQDQVEWAQELEGARGTAQDTTGRGTQIRDLGVILAEVLAAVCSDGVLLAAEDFETGTTPPGTRDGCATAHTPTRIRLGHQLQ